MLVKTLQSIFERDLTKLVTEIEAYNTEGDLWLSPIGISNCAGNLCLHLVGNLNAFIGAELGKTGYVRQRDLEFSLKNIPKKELIAQVNKTKTMVSQTLSNLTETDLGKNYPLDVFGDPMTTQFFLVHLTTHLAYHLGQINYHRRLLDV